jgi:hypothetical protein
VGLITNLIAIEALELTVQPIQPVRREKLIRRGKENLILFLNVRSQQWNELPGGAVEPVELLRCPCPLSMAASR